ncbi:Tim44 domain-containing protein [Rhodovarius crocodyli]|uniref:Tim44 domain-containing protein n=1 Tax=Rhodovarius crocodyli TaxID=1979269 RepID=A0A437MEW6_9PROT|nr:TIM44-like domain-containing protein [Rhodovarius crocodyli]RVT96162.1 Tim44 domain-containing protein [Rhodovarius crocodyli]
MRSPARFVAIAAAALLALAPALADARPGGGSSSGSRGSRTFMAPPSTNTAPRTAPTFDRTQQTPTRPDMAPSAQRPMPGAAQPARQGFFQRNPFMGGLMAGMLGAGIFGLLAGGGFFSGLGSLAGILGFLLQIGLIIGLVMVLRMIFMRRQQPAMAGGMPREAMQPEQRAHFGGGGAAPRRGNPDEIGISAQDQMSFGNTLVEVNRAWSAQDMAALQRIATPEMVQYFRDDYAALAARGWRNETSDVRLEQGDVAEAWRENAREYCTVAMRFSMIDVTRRLSDGAVVEGDPTRRTTATELWTFVRVQGGPWMLSAIQQPGA